MKLLSSLVPTLLIVYTSLCQPALKKDSVQIYKVVSNQALCWNSGNIQCFMEGYWKSDSLKFVSSVGITRGWETVKNNYIKKYPNKEAMGFLTLKLSNLIQPGKKLIIANGAWHIHRSADELGGFFTLFWKKIKGKWLIVLDHTS